MIIMGNTSITPRLGAIVRYTLSEMDVREIIQRRREAGSAVRRGNDPREGDTYPAMIVRDWVNPEMLAKVKDGTVTSPSGVVMDLDDYRNNASVNLQVFLDGNDVYWATSRTRFNPERNGRFREGAPDFYYGDFEPPQGADDEELARLAAKWNEAYRQANAAYKAEWFEPDYRGTWTDEPVAW